MNSVYQVTEMEKDVPCKGIVWKYNIEVWNSVRRGWRSQERAGCFWAVKWEGSSEKKGARKTGIGAWTALPAGLRVWDSLLEALGSQWKVFSKRITWLDILKNIFKIKISTMVYDGTRMEAGRQLGFYRSTVTWWDTKLRYWHRG